ncbi:Asp-tRNA(Asn)/Glu-tRNA(Gln) amidotransferase subunit GatB [Candidatus Micrarchaeota archaeon]|nr:Asp-tRNA(Asn)/Glu-tRNA(Gln) amidotransferase subunit GatB [Candidatus Micrarchaeota archaeon]
MVVIGLEIHVQLKTKSKLFCKCSATYRDVEQNSNICPICTSQPGSKPMAITRRALENLLKIGLALNCKIKIDERIYIQRKHYFYPDLPSNYQRTSLPIAYDGMVSNIRIRELHIEEDPGRYELRKGLVDYNRSGVPLVEIVTDPDLRSPEEARMFLEELQAITGYLDATREEPGSMRIDANISLEGGNRVEVKNINSYKGVYTALKYEIIRQGNLVQKGLKVEQETRHFDEAQGITLGSRKKESVADYRYIPDPDLPPILVTESLVTGIRNTIPELPRDKARRLVKQFRIKEEDAWILVSEKEVADLFEELAKEIDPQACASWLRGPLKKQLNYRNLLLKDSGLSKQHIKELIQMYVKNEITDKIADELLISLFKESKSPRKMAEELGLKTISNVNEIEEIVKKIIKESPKAVEDYSNGEEKALHFLSGKVMKETKGRASPEIVRDLLKKLVGK